MRLAHIFPVVYSKSWHNALGYGHIWLCFEKTHIQPSGANLPACNQLTTPIYMNKDSVTLRGWGRWVKNFSLLILLSCFCIYMHFRSLFIQFFFFNFQTTILLAQWEHWLQYSSNFLVLVKIWKCPSAVEWVAPAFILMWSIRKNFKWTVI